VLGETTPGGGKFEGDLLADQTKDGAGNEHLGAQGGGLAVGLVRSDPALIEAEQVEIASI